MLIDMIFNRASMYTQTREGKLVWEMNLLHMNLVCPPKFGQETRATSNRSHVQQIHCRKECVGCVSGD